MMIDGFDHKCYDAVIMIVDRPVFGFLFTGTAGAASAQEVRLG